MKREILFRGKRLDNGEWVYGYPFISDTDGSAYILLGSRRVTLEFEIDPDTLKPYTGLTDKNGVKIFEGDIIQNIETYEVFEVIHKGHQFMRKYEDGVQIPTFTNYGKAYRIIGNIHDNLELLEVQHEAD